MTRASYDVHLLLPTTATDPVGNVTSAASDYRVLAPATVTDPNGNRVSAAFDVLGRVTATAVMGKTSESLGDELTGFSADLDEATLAAAFADPVAGAAALLGNATTRILYDAGAYQRTSTGGAAVTARRAHHRPRDPRLRPDGPPAVPGGHAGHPLPVPPRLRRRVRAGHPAQGPGGAGPGHRRGPVGHLGLDDLRQQGPPGPRLRAVLLGRSRLRVRRGDRCRHRHLLRPAGPGGGGAPSRQHVGEDHVRPVAAGRLGRRRHRARVRPAHRPRRR